MSMPKPREVPLRRLSHGVYFFMLSVRVVPDWDEKASVVTSDELSQRRDDDHFVERRPTPCLAPHGRAEPCLKRRNKECPWLSRREKNCLRTSKLMSRKRVPQERHAFFFYTSPQSSVRKSRSAAVSFTRTLSPRENA